MAISKQDSGSRIKFGFKDIPKKPLVMDSIGNMELVMVLEGDELNLI